MGIFNFFKKLKKKSGIEEITIENLAFSNIENWIKDNSKQNSNKQKEIILIIKDKIKDHSNKINNKIEILKDVDISSKKERDNVKGIVNNSKKDYIWAIENFLNSLNNLEIKEFEGFMNKINKIFLNFNKSSDKNYQRANILIGKEIVEVKAHIHAFSNDLLKIYNNNKEITDFLKIISQIKSKYQGIKPIDENINKIIKKTLYLEKKIDEKEEENQLLNQKIEEIKKGQDYLNYLNHEKEIELLKSDLIKNISELRQLLDFKSLANFFHINKEQMKILKEHKEDFYTNFKKDNGKIIINFLDEAKLNNNTISEKIDLIRSKIDKKEHHKKNIKKDKTKEIYSKIKNILIEINDLKEEKLKEEKIDKKLKLSKKELINSLKEEFNRINIKII